jgi:6-phosphogluconolactonase
MKRFSFSFLFLFVTISIMAQLPYRVLVGTYTEGTESKGIYSYHVYPENGKAELIAVCNSKNPSYLAFSPDKNFVYAVNETGGESTLSSFFFDKNSGNLSFMQKAGVSGADPCFLAISNFHIATANYSGGNISVFDRKTNGTFEGPIDIIQHTGSSTKPNQTAPHVHQVKFTINGKFLLASDLGTDEIYVYKYTVSPQFKTLQQVNKLKLKEGSGPRHIAINRKSNRIYVMHENDASVTVLSINPRGELNILQQTSVALKQDIEVAGADIHLSPDEKFLYVSNRGTANDITCFSIEKNGLLKFVEQVSTRGNGPRNFTITPDGNYVFIAHQHSNNITLFKRDKRSGRLVYMGNDIELPSPVCLLMY